MKSLKTLMAIASILAALVLAYFGLRLVPGALVFVLLRDLALDAGLDRYGALSVALIASAIPAAIILWRGFSWRKLAWFGMAVPVLLGGYFAAKSVFYNRSREVSNLDSRRWFADDGQALLSYVRESSGNLLFSDHSGFHSQTGQQLKPVTPEIYREWRQQCGIRHEDVSEKQVLKEELARLSLGTADNLHLERKERIKGENQLLVELTETRNLATQLQSGLEKAKCRLDEGLANQTLEVAEMRQGLQVQIQAVEEKLRQEGDKRTNSANALQKQLDEFRHVDRINSERDAKKQVGRSLDGKVISEILKLRESNTAMLRQGVAVVQKIGQFEEQAHRTAEDAQKAEAESRRLQNQLVVKIAEMENSGAREINLVQNTLSNLQAHLPARAGAATNYRSSVPKDSTVTIRLQNSTQFKMRICFSNQVHSWQSPGCSWVAEAGKTLVVTLSGPSGEQVFYNAWMEQYPFVQWTNCTPAGGGTASPTAIFGECDPPLISLIYRPF